MVHGFNTDVRHRGRLFHIQTEYRDQSDQILATLVYSGGCIVAASECPCDGPADLRTQIRSQHARVIRDLLRDRLDVTLDGSSPAEPDLEPTERDDRSVPDGETVGAMETVAAEIAEAMDAVDALEAAETGAVVEAVETVLADAEARSSSKRLKAVLARLETQIDVDAPRSRDAIRPGTIPQGVPSRPRRRLGLRIVAGVVLPGAVAVFVLVMPQRSSHETLPEAAVVAKREDLRSSAISARSPSDTPAPSSLTRSTSPPLARSASPPSASTAAPSSTLSVPPPSVTATPPSSTLSDPPSSATTASPSLTLSAPTPSVTTTPPSSTLFVPPPSVATTPPSSTLSTPPSSATTTLPSATLSTPPSSATTASPSSTLSAPPPAATSAPLSSEVSPAPPTDTPSRVEASASIAPDPYVDDSPAAPAIPEVIPPKAVSRPFPEYTQKARRKKQTGTIALNILVDTKGKVTDVELLEAIPDSTLNDAAIETARTWRYQPASTEGQPVEAWKRVFVHFRIGAGRSEVVSVEE